LALLASNKDLLASNKALLALNKDLLACRKDLLACRKDFVGAQEECIWLEDKECMRLEVELRDSRRKEARLEADARNRENSEVVHG
jgi:hypothetical protein